jgi:hypothetical protein
MESRARRTRRLVRASAAVLREDRRLLIFPVASAAFSLALGAVCFVLAISTTAGGTHLSRLILLATLAASYPITFISIFCGVGLAAVLERKLRGEPATVADGWAAARARVGVIAGWAVLVCTVGAILRVIEQYVPLGGKIFTWIADVSWALATLFAVPVLAYEGLGPLETLKRSSGLFRQRWAEQVAGTVGIGVLSGFVSLPFVFLLVAGTLTSGPAGVVLIAVGGGGLLAVAAVQVAMDQIFRVFLYRHALGLDGDSSSGPFERADLDQPFRRKQHR